MPSTRWSSSLVPEPLNTLKELRELSVDYETWDSGRFLEGIFNSVRFGAIQFNPGFGNQRFSPFEVYGSKVPCIYAGETFEAAVSETILRSRLEEQDPIYRSISSADIAPLSIAGITCSRNLKLLKLNEVSLQALKLTRRTFLEPSRAHYEATQIWARKLYMAFRNIDGFIWRGRWEEEYCFVLYETRLIGASLEVHYEYPLKSGTGYQNLEEYLDRIGVSIIRA